MNYLIDGYNLIGHITHMDLAHATKQAELKAFLERYQLEKDHYTIIFDGKSKENTIGINEHYGHISIFYTAYGESADQHIMATCATLQNPKSITVVSSDKEIVNEARRYRVPTLSSQDFIRTLKRPNSHDNKPEPNPEDTNFWLDQMG